MTTAELDAIKARHVVDGTGNICEGCEYSLWPCDTAQVLAELEREVAHSEALGDEIGDLQEVLAAELAWHEPCQDGHRTQPVCRICSEINRHPSDRWACAAGRRLAAVLGGAVHG